MSSSNIPINPFQSHYDFIDNRPIHKLSPLARNLVIRAQSVSTAYKKITNNDNLFYSIPKFREAPLLQLFALLGCKNKAHSLIHRMDNSPVLNNLQTINDIRKTLLHIESDIPKQEGALLNHPFFIDDLFNLRLDSEKFYESLLYFLQKEKHVGLYILKGIQHGERVIGNSTKAKNFFEIFKEELQAIFGENYPLVISLREKQSHTAIETYSQYMNKNFLEYTKSHSKFQNQYITLFETMENFFHLLEKRKEFDARYKN